MDGFSIIQLLLRAIMCNLRVSETLTAKTVNIPVAFKLQQQFYRKDLHTNSAEAMRNTHVLQCCDFFQDIFIHFPYGLTTGKRDHKTTGKTPAFLLKEAQEKQREGKKTQELQREREREREREGEREREKKGKVHPT